MKYEFKEYKSLKYIIRYPDSYNEGDKYPVIIFLHGAGSRGEDLNILKENPYFLITDSYEDFPFITVAPQCNQNTWFDAFETLKRFAVKIATESYVDEKRIYLMGPSMGGYAVWQLAMSMPEMFAAIVPICGGGMYWNAPRLVNTPVWAFHGEKDKVVLVEESIKMVDATNKAGGCAKLIIYSENEHDAWGDTYKNYEVFLWLLSNENKNNKKLYDKFNDSKIFG